MLIVPGQLPRRYRRKTAKTTVSPVPPVGPVLIAATYVPGASVTLTFQQPITVTAGSMNSMMVFDADSATAYVGDDYDVVSATQIRVYVYSQEGWTGQGVTMIASEPTGIVSTDGQIDWDGASVGLPYP